MAPTVHRVGGIAGLAVTLSLGWAGAATAGPAPEPPEARCAVQQVEVPVAVSVDDTNSEAFQMAVAAALAAVLTYVAIGPRAPRSKPPAARIIDITHVVRSRLP
jgi:hypothetical protein